MSLPENYAPRKGDVVALLATVKHNSDLNEDVFLDIPGYYQSVILKRKHVDRVVTQLIEPGDDIITNGGRGKVIAVHDGLAWIDDGGGTFTAEIDKCQRYAGDQE